MTGKSGAQLRELGPDDAVAVHAFVTVENAVRAHDAPWQHPDTPFRREMTMRHGWDGEVGRHFLWLAEGAPVGTVVVETSEWDNRDLAWLHVAIHPDHRRRGHGTAALEAAFDVARGMGRTLVGLDGWDSERTTGFATATGFDLKSQSINRRQHLRELAPGLAEEVRDEAARHAADYELLRLQGTSPDDLLEELAEVSAAINDAPLDDLELEDEVYTADRLRDYEAAQAAGGYRLYRVVARHRGTGALAGHTAVAVDAERPELGEQHDTAVARQHRGHRLGALVKADMMLWLAEAEPQLATVDTWNAESNDHMIRVNERLGYRVVARQLEFQRRI
ncbi:GNAT family N-acetyltransferase [Nocardioides sp. GCM10027113]|uniref:GNAT family N-acetyltransferase n=1 Tax=unclassified Nocardioides TaxID=2615069 RepID=UPI00360D1133